MGQTVGFAAGSWIVRQAAKNQELTKERTDAQPPLPQNPF